MPSLARIVCRLLDPLVIVPFLPILKTFFHLLEPDDEAEILGGVDGEEWRGEAVGEIR